MTNGDKTSQKGNVLIVDDAPNNLRLLSNMLTQQGYDVRVAINGSIALKTVQALAPDIILLDINMPKMDGYEVCQRLKSDPETKDIPIIFLSALSEVLNKVKAFESGGVDYVTKPFQLEEVVARVDSQLTLKRVQVELKEAKEAALRALEKEKDLNRLKSEFVSMISHDFRTPLTSIRGFTGLLRDSQDKLTLETQTRYFDKIEASIDHMLYLLDEVLLIGSSDIGKTQFYPILIDLESFCHELAETMQVSISSQHRICFSSTGTCTRAEMDTTLLRQLLTNLLSNAIKYSPEGGEIQFLLDCRDETAVIRVSDRGIGIPKEHHPKLFQAFHRCSNVGTIQGNGLGLAVVSKCVDMHQGHITFSSEEGVGTTFTVTLPLFAKQVTPE